MIVRASAIGSWKLSRVLRNLAGVVVVALFAVVAQSATRYKASVFYQVPTDGFRVTAMSDRGDMTGNVAKAGGGGDEAFFWKAGVSPVRLGTLGGANSYGAAVNNNGQVVGTSYIAGNTDRRAFLYAGSSMQDLGTLGGTGHFNPSRPSLSTFGSDAYGISDNGQVTGSALTVAGESHAFLYSNGSMRDLGVLPGGTSSVGIGVNSNGDVTGSSHAGGPSHAFLYSNGLMLDLGTLGGARSAGVAINENRQVAGNSTIAGDLASHAFLYSGGSIKDLGTLGGPSSSAGDIDNSGQVVGFSETGEPGGRAFIFTDGVTYDLNTLVDSGLGGARLVVISMRVVHPD